MTEEKIEHLDSNVARVTRDMTKQKIDKLTSDKDCYGMIVFGFYKDGSIDAQIESEIYKRTFHAIGGLSYISSLLKKATRGFNDE